MARITREGFEACLAFATVSLAVAETAELVAAAPRAIEPTILDLFVSLRVAHRRLRDLFAQGNDAGVFELAPKVLELAERTADALG